MGLQGPTGPRGPEGGPPGPPGTPGVGTYYEHVQSTEAPTWIVNHNLGRTPGAVRLLTPAGVEFEGAVTHTSANQLQVSLAAAAAGRVICFG